MTQNRIHINTNQDEVIVSRVVMSPESLMDLSEKIDDELTDYYKEQDKEEEKN